MKKRKLWISAISGFAVITTIIVLAAIIPLSVSADETITYSGVCGDNIQWSLDTQTGILKIVGTGDMTDYNHALYHYAPWYPYRQSIKEIEISDGVTSIGAWTFTYFNSIESIDLPDSIAKIGWAAFAGCKSLTSITIPEGVTAIGKSTFEYCTSLEEVSLPNGITYIGNDAFHDCSNLERITIPASVNRIYEEAFLGCSNLIEIENGISYVDKWVIDCETNAVNAILRSDTEGIADSAFHHCSNLCEIELPTGVKNIGGLSFASCTSLESITIPDSVTNIDYGAFWGCTNLESIIIPNGVTGIYSFTFSDCSNLINVSIPSGIKYINSNAFDGCEKLKYTEYNNGKYLGNDANPYVVLADVIDTSVLSFNIPDCTKIIYSWALSKCKNITSITIPDGVTDISFMAFAECSSLKNISIPDSVTSIGMNAFDGCESLESIIIPNSVTSIGSFAFRDCTNLISISIPDSVTSIGEYAFDGCESLEIVNIPNSVESIESKTFHGCIKLKSITIPSSVTKIKENIFYGCTSLESISIDENNPIYHSSGNCIIETKTKILVFGCKNSSIPADGSVTSIDSGAFEGMASLENITIPHGVTNIGGSAFRGCTGLTSISLPDSVTSIGGYAFYNCTSLESITIPDSVTIIAEYAFFCCTSLENITIPDSVTNIDFGAFVGCTGLTDISLTDSVTSIGDSAFSGCTGLTDISLPDSVTSIGDSAFYNCTSLESITIPDSVTSIGYSAFQSCENLEAVYITDIVSWCNINFRSKDSNPLNYAHDLYLNGTLLTDLVIPNGVTSIGNSAFIGCTNLISISIPDSVTSIGEYAFYECESLEIVNIPDGVESIKYHTFYGCINLKNITIPESVNIIDSGAFSRCTSLESITIPNSVTRIKGNAFSYCASLESITIPDGITAIEDMSFHCCANLKSITIPNSVTSIGNYAFSGCTGLTNISIPDRVTSIGNNAFRGCTGLTNISIPDSVTSIEYSVFENCTSLESITIPDSVTSIGDSAFYNCTSLKSITIPDSVTSIHSYAFYNCTSLKSITIPNSVTSIGYRAFEGCYKLIEVYNFSPINIIIGDASNGYIGYYALDVYTTQDDPTKIYKVNDYVFYCDGNTVYLIGYTGKENALILPSDYQGNDYDIYKYAFYGCKDLISISISDSVTSIGEYAFMNCTNLISITIPGSVTSIGDYTFYECENLESVYNCSNLSIIAGSPGNGFLGYYAENIYNHLYSDDLVVDDLTHYYECSFCHVHKDESKHIFSNHISNKNNTHTDICFCGKTEVQNCFGGTATCTEYAICEICNDSYGEIASNDHLLSLISDEVVHYYECSRCGDRNEVSDHQYADFVSSGNNTHTGTCICGKTLTENCSGGIASCTIKASCVLCGSWHGDLKPHDYTQKYDKAMHWNECSCGAIAERTMHEFENYSSNGNGSHSSTCVCGITELKYCFGGIATCTEQAVCGKCNEKYGEVSANNHKYSLSLIQDTETHYYECTRCGDRNEEEKHEYLNNISNRDNTHTGTCICGKTSTVNCSGGIATCTEQAVCEMCREKYGEVSAYNHKYSLSLIQDTETHYYECTRCGDRNEEEDHQYKNFVPSGSNTHRGTCICGKTHKEGCYGGVATCKDRAICDICNRMYGNRSDHNFEDTLTIDAFNHYYKCIYCNARKDTQAHDYQNIVSNNNGTHTGICSCGKQGTEHCLGGTATCTDKAICEICLTPYGELTAHIYTTVFSNETEHWMQCSECNNKSNIEQHIFTTKNECYICGQEKADIETTDETEMTGETETTNDPESTGETETTEEIQSVDETETTETPSASETTSIEQTTSKQNIDNSNSGSSSAGCGSSMNSGIIAILSAAILGAITFKRKKEN